MNSTNAAPPTTVTDPPRGAETGLAVVVPTPPGSLYPPTTTADAAEHGVHGRDESTALTPAMQVRMSLLRRLWAATVNMRKRFSLRLHSGGVRAPVPRRSRRRLMRETYPELTADRGSSPDPRGSPTSPHSRVRDDRSRATHRLDRHSRPRIPLTMRSAARAVPAPHMCPDRRRIPA